MWRQNYRNAQQILTPQLSFLQIPCSKRSYCDSKVINKKRVGATISHQIRNDDWEPKSKHYLIAVTK